MAFVAWRGGLEGGGGGGRNFYCVCIQSYLSFQTKTAMGEAMKEAVFSLAEANFAAGDFR